MSYYVLTPMAICCKGENNSLTATNSSVTTKNCFTITDPESGAELTTVKAVFNSQRGERM